MMHTYIVCVFFFNVHLFVFDYLSWIVCDSGWDGGDSGCGRIVACVFVFVCVCVCVFSHKLICGVRRTTQ